MYNLNVYIQCFIHSVHFLMKTTITRNSVCKQFLQHAVVPKLRVYLKRLFIQINTVNLDGIYSKVGK